MNIENLNHNSHCLNGKKNILLGLTTTPGSDWRTKILEIDKLQIKEIALFPTFLKKEDRFELYSLLSKTHVKSIPHVHLRDKMQEDELDYLVDKYNVRVFNVHGNDDVIKKYRSSKYRGMIYVENLEKINDEFLRSLEVFSGICLDVSHWEDIGVVQGEKSYKKFEKLLETHKIGCSHVSAMTKEAMFYENYRTKENIKFYSRHYMRDLSELDYLKKYLKYLPNLVSIELENSFEEQLNIKSYLDKIINNF